MSSRPQLDSALARARAFVGRHGEDLARLRARALMGEAKPADVEQLLEGRQDASGAVASFAGGERAGLGSTTEALEWLADLRLLGLPCAERAAGYIASFQLADGSFGEPPEAALETRLQQSGRLAPVLARMRCVPLARLAAVGEFLAGQFSVERVQAGGFEDLAPFLPFFALHPHDLSDEALQWCGRELERSFRLGRLSPLEAGRLLVRSAARALPATRLDGREIVPALLATQRADGSFGRGDSEARSRVGDTLEAILVLLRLG
jgi:hypothetical protein